MPPPVRLAIAAVVRRADGCYLLIRRAPGIPAAGYWTPVTGRLEEGEALERAVEREVREEVGLDVRTGAELHRCRTEDDRYLLVWFEAALAGPGAAEPALALLPSEVAEARWLTAGEAARLEPMFARTRAFFAARALPDRE